MFSFISVLSSILQKMSEAVARRCSVKKAILKTSQNSDENNCVRASFLMKLQVCSLQLYSKSVSSIVIFLRILQNF